MKKSAIMSICTILVLSVLISSCAGGAFVRNSGADFTEMEGMEWKLLELRRGRRTVQIDRESVGMGGGYTINFYDGRVNGMGAINLFFGPYSKGPGNTLSIGDLAGTLMAALFEPEALSEREYFTFLSRVSRWDLRRGRLELYSTDNDGNAMVLVFEQNQNF